MTRANDMNQDTFINRLLVKGVIVRADVRGLYTIPSSSASHTKYSRNELLQSFGIEVAPGRYIFKASTVERYTPVAVINRPTRTIQRERYHSQPRNISNALERIPLDADGVRRSYGIEYEIAALNSEQESELAYLLDTLPAHILESDGSLRASGVEIIFEPLGRDDAVRVVKTLAVYIRQYSVSMEGAGMHITVGVSSSVVSATDLIIRTNRLALAIKSCALQSQIKALFGRDFTDYARLPSYLNDTVRYRAFNVRNEAAWECRLTQWNCNIEKVMEFFKIAEPLFQRAFAAQDFIKLFQLLGADTDGI